MFVFDRWFGSKNTADPAGRHCSSRDHDEHYSYEEKAHDHVYRILHESHDLSDHKISGLNHPGTGPDDENAGCVHDQCYRRGHEGHRSVDKYVKFCQIHVCIFETILLMLFSAEGAHDQKTAEPLADDKIEAVKLVLKNSEFGHYCKEQDHHQKGNNYDRYAYCPSHSGAEPDSIDQCPDPHQRSEYRHPQYHHRCLLHVLHVICGAGDQAGSRKTREFSR